MKWEYLELRFALEFDSSQINRSEETKKTMGITETEYNFEIPENLSWKLIALINEKQEVIVKGSSKRQDNGFEYLYRVDNIKPSCMSYINNLGNEGWELIKMEPVTSGGIIWQGASTDEFLVVFKREKSHNELFSEDDVKC